MLSKLASDVRDAVTASIKSADDIATQLRTAVRDSLTGIATVPRELLGSILGSDKA